MDRANSRTLSVLSGLLCFAIGGCVDPAATEEDFASSEEALSPANWTGATTVGPDPQGAHYGGTVVTLNGVTYMVHSGGCDDCNQLWWTKLTANGWTEDIQIPNQLAADRVSLAAFNGFIYMVHTGDSDTTAVWFSRFDPRTEQWTPNSKLAYTSRETPAIMAFRGRLYMIGNRTSGTYQLWQATMDVNETWSAQTMLSQWSTSRASLAVFDRRLYIVHRHQNTNRIVVNYFNGSQWEWNRPIDAGDGTMLESTEPSIASVGGYLHLVFKKPGSGTLWWTTYDGIGWAVPATINTLTSYADPSIGTGGAGLVLTLTRRCPSGHVCFSKNMLLTAQYIQPPEPFDPWNPPVVTDEVGSTKDLFDPPIVDTIDPGTIEPRTGTFVPVGDDRLAP